jgi:hypothetical protein
MIQESVTSYGNIPHQYRDNKNFERDLFSVLSRYSFWKKVAIEFLTSLKEAILFVSYVIVSLFNYVAITSIALFNWLFDFGIIKMWVLTTVTIFTMVYIVHEWTVLPWWSLIAVSLLPSHLRWWSILASVLMSLLSILII